jgi:cytochrome oxidase Cu insertion factor (SCO1/SenC/PrrC family)
MNERAARVVTVLILLGAVGVLGYAGWHQYRAATEFADPLNLPPVVLPAHRERPSEPWYDLEFTERSGRRLKLGDLKGRVWIASFFFASCPGFCAKMNQTVASLQQELAGQDVTFVSITVDPERDTPAALEKYAGEYKADPDRWLFLTGELHHAEAVGDAFRVTVVARDHSDRLILVDRDLRVQGTYHSLEEADLKRLKRDLQKLLAQP